MDIQTKGKKTLVRPLAHAGKALLLFFGESLPPRGSPIFALECLPSRDR
jgi:hypothetical protein